MLGFIVILFGVLCIETALSQFTSYGSCSVSGCGLTCGLTSFDLTSISVYQPSYVNIQYATYFATFTVQFLVPVCGTTPSSSYSWTTGDIWQYDSGGTYYLGLYTAQWSFGTYNGVAAVYTQYTNGQWCGSYYRYTNVYLVCNSAYSASSPYISMSETTTCVYTLVIQYADICDSPPTPSPTLTILPSARPTRSPSGPTMTPSKRPTTAPTAVPSKTVVPTTFLQQTDAVTTNDDKQVGGMPWQIMEIIIIPIVVSVFLIAAGAACCCVWKGEGAAGAVKNRESNDNDVEMSNIDNPPTVERAQVLYMANPSSEERAQIVHIDNQPFAEKAEVVYVQ